MYVWALFQFRYEVTGVWGAVAAVLIAAALIIGVIKSAHWLWTTPLVRPRKWIVRWWHRRSLKQKVAFLKFRQDWLINHLKNTPEAVLDEDQICVSVNEAMCRLLQRDSTELLGRKFKKLVGNGWEASYETQTPYEDVRTIKVGGALRAFRLQAEPFVFRGKTMKVIITLEPEVYVEQKLLNE